MYRLEGQDFKGEVGISKAYIYLETGDLLL